MTRAAKLGGQRDTKANWSQVRECPACDRREWRFLQMENGQAVISGQKHRLKDNFTQVLQQ